MLMDEEAFELVSEAFEAAKEAHFAIRNAGVSDTPKYWLTNGRYDALSHVRERLFEVKQRTTMLDNTRRLERRVDCLAYVTGSGSFVGRWLLFVEPLVGDVVEFGGSWRVERRTITAIGLRLDVVSL